MLSYRHPEVPAPTGPARSGRPDDKLRAGLEGCWPKRSGRSRPSRLADCVGERLQGDGTWISGWSAAPYRHQGTGVDLGLLGRVFGLALAHLVALVEQFDLLKLIEGVAERQFGVLELGP